MQQFEVVGLQKKTLKELVPDTNNVFIVGIIIAKQKPRHFTDSRGDVTKDRSVWNFTLRDSLQDYINATYWGLSEQINQSNNRFQVGDVVDVIRPKIEIRKVNDSGEQYRPMVTSPYMLILSETSQIIAHEGPDTAQYYKLIHYPTKPLAGFIKLSDANNDRFKTNSVLMDLLGAIRSVGEIRNIKAKDGRETQMREVVIFDHSSPGFRFSIWDPELMIRAGSWKPRTTILFLADVRIGWSTFHRTAQGNLISKTIITEDPIGPEADLLRNYAKSAPLQTSAILDQMATSIVDPNNIQNVMSVKQVLDKIDLLVASQSMSSDQQFTGLLYVFVVNFDLDGPRRTIAIKCPNCYAPLPTVNSTCENPECANDNQKPVINFDILMSLSDQTGTLENCRLNNNFAENILNCSIEEFRVMGDEHKCNLKWKFLLERCAVRIMVLCMQKRRPLISVLSCALASPVEVANRLPQY